MVVPIGIEEIEGKSWRNGANTAYWENIVNSLRRIDCPTYLGAIIQGSFLKRVLDTDKGIKKYNVTIGVTRARTSFMENKCFKTKYSKKDDIAVTIVRKIIDETRTEAESSNAMGFLLAEH